jgi:Zinc finger, C3HC4 type (RING finger)
MCLLGCFDYDKLGISSSFSRLISSCHPSLVTTASDASDAHPDTPNSITWSTELAKMSKLVVNRMLESNISESECVICLDVLNNGVVVSACGHAYCKECIMRELLPRTEHQCPQCRGNVNINALIPLSEFMKQHGPFVKEEVLPVFRVKKESDISVEELDDALEIDERLMSHSFQKRLAKGKDGKGSAKKHKKGWITSSKIEMMLQKLNEIRSEGLGEKTISTLFFIRITQKYSLNSLRSWIYLKSHSSNLDSNSLA